MEGETKSLRQDIKGGVSKNKQVDILTNCTCKIFYHKHNLGVK